MAFLFEIVLLAFSCSPTLKMSTTSVGTQQNNKSDVIVFRRQDRSSCWWFTVTLSFEKKYSFIYIYIYVPIFLLCGFVLSLTVWRLIIVSVFQCDAVPEKKSNGRIYI
jgi:hypothetical protein